MTRRSLLFAVTLVALVGLPLLAAQARRTAAPPSGIVYVDPSCGCCSKWIQHMSGAFALRREATDNLDAVPARQKVPERLRSCHTAVIGPYVVEGHVPVDVVQKLLAEKPDVVGIAVPGMPVGSPGMEGGTPQPYSVIAFKADGTTYEFAKR
jgi:hypothetical protein